MSNSSLIVSPTTVTKPRVTQKRTATEMSENAPPAKLPISEMAKTSDVVVNTYDMYF